MSTDSPVPEIDPKAVLNSLGFTEPTEIEPVTGGWDAALWRFSTEDGSQHGLRVYRSPERKGDAERERAAMEAAAAAGLPVAPVRASGRWREFPALVVDWRPGTTLVRCIERRPWALWSLGRQLGRLQARLHAVPVPRQLREGAPRYWLRRVGAGEEGERFASALTSAGLSCEAFIHLDYHPLNVVSDGRAITGVLDWTMAAAGDVRADLAWTTNALRWGPVPPSPIVRLLQGARLLLYLAWRGGYKAQAGPMPELGPFLPWAGTVYLTEVDAQLGQPQVWATERDVVAARRRVAEWKRQAGIT